jgi:hypothetical protein
MTEATISSAAMSKLINSKIAKVQKQEEAVAAQKEVVSATVSASEEVVAATPKKVMLGGQLVRGKRAKDDVSIYLTNLKIAESSENRMKAWSKIIEIVVKYPKKSIFDSIYAFFKENKSEEFLQENAALQGINELDMTVHQRTRILYAVMMNLVRGTASRKNTSIELLRNIFGNDDFATWVSIKLGRR